MRSIIDILDLSKEEIQDLIAVAEDIIEKILQNTTKSAKTKRLLHSFLNRQQEQD